MKTVKRILRIAALVIAVAVIGYFVYTGAQL